MTFRTALSGGQRPDWSTAFNLCGTDTDDVAITIGDGTGTSYHWNSAHQAFE